MSYTIYFDSGTSNTRIYLLGDDLRVLHSDSINVGSKDSALAGGNSIILDTLSTLYTRTLSEMGLKDEDIVEIYGSGMLTSPYGLTEISHKLLPISADELCGSLVSYRLGGSINRDILLVPGLKKTCRDSSLVGNMRGEETEIIGALSDIAERNITNAAIVLPGSHTQIAYVRGETIVDILSTFTGELFHALQNNTILAPILNVVPSAFDPDMIELAMKNLNAYGFNRAIYIGHSMRIMDSFTPEQRCSYCEGVINGGIRQALEYYLDTKWTDCSSVVFICTERIFELFTYIFKDSKYYDWLIWLPITKDSNYAVRGIQRIVSERGKNNENYDHISFIWKDK